MALQDYSLSSSILGGSSENDTPYVNTERNPFMSFIHSAISGSSDALRLYGRGYNANWAVNAADWIDSTSIAKPDLSEYFGTKSETQDVIDSAVRSIPTSAVLMGSTVLGGALGTVGGPAGQVAGATAGAAIGGTGLARGIFLVTRENILKQHPEMSIEDATNYALLTATNETATELLGTAVDVMTAKLGGSMAKSWIRKGLDTGILSAEDIIGSVAKKEGIGKVAAKIFGSSTMEGAEGIVNDKLQYEVDKAYNLNPETPDYFKTFLVASLASAPMVGPLNLHEVSQRNKVADNLVKGLTSEDIKQREYTANQVYDVINKVSPEAAASWKAYTDLNVPQGPLDIQKSIGTDSAWQLNFKNFQAEREQDPQYQQAKAAVALREAAKVKEAEDIRQITEDPGRILQEAGIETDTPIEPAKPTATQVSPKEPMWKTQTPGEIRDQFYSDPIQAMQAKNAEVMRNTPESEVKSYSRGNIEAPVPEVKGTEANVSELNKTQRTTEDRVPDYGPSVPQWQNPIKLRQDANAIEMNKAMGLVHEDSNTVNPEKLKALEIQQAEEAKVKAQNDRINFLSEKPKLTLKEKAELKRLTKEQTKVAEVPKTEEQKTTTVIKTPAESILNKAEVPQQITETKQTVLPESKSTLTAEIPKGYEHITDTQLKDTKVQFDYYGKDLFKDIDAHKALTLLEGDEKIYNELLKCVKGGGS